MTKSQTRSDGTQLPSTPEILDILENESKRKAVKFDFIENNLSIFDIHRTLSKLADSDDSWIDDYKDVSIDELVMRIEKNHSDIKEYVFKNQDDKDLYKKFYRSLIPNEDESPSEAIFVFGAASNARIERAVQLYGKNIASKIVISGKGPFYIQNGISEARRMAVFATSQGVDENNIILEEDSISIPDNVKRTIDLMESMEWQPSSLTIVATNMVLARATMDWYRFCPWDITLKPVSAHPQSARFTEDGWSADVDTISLVLNEYAKIILETKIELIGKAEKIN